MTPAKHTKVCVVVAVVGFPVVDAKQREALNGRWGDGGDDHENGGHEQQERADVVDGGTETHCDGW